MSSLTHHLGRRAVAGLVFAAMSAPSVAGASTAAASTASSSSTVSTASLLPLSGSIGPFSYWIAPGAAASFQVGTSGCTYVLVENLILPVGAWCTVNGRTFGVIVSNGVLVPIFT